MDGILGLSVGTFKDTFRKVYIEALYDEGKIDKKVFTIFLGDNDTYTTEEQSKLWIGKSIES